MIKKILSICLILGIIISSIGCTNITQTSEISNTQNVVETEALVKEPEEIKLNFDKIIEAELLQLELERKEKERKESKLELTNTLDNTINSIPAIEQAPTGDEVTWVGDSYTASSSMKEYLMEKLPGIEIYSRGGKRTAAGSASNQSGLQIVKDLNKENKIRKYLVFALGTNDGGSKEKFLGYIDELMENVPEDTIVIMATIFTLKSYNGDANYDGVNAAIYEAAEKYSNFKIAKWKEIARPQVREFFNKTDRVHPNNKGRYVWADLLIEAVKYKKLKNNE